MEIESGGAAGRGPEQQRASWILPGRPPGGLPALAAIVRDRWLLAVVIAALVVIAGVGFSKLRADRITPRRC